MKMKILFAVLGVALVGVALYFGNAGLFQGKIQTNYDVYVTNSPTQFQVKTAVGGEKALNAGEFVFTAGKDDVKLQKIAFYPALEGTKIPQFTNVVLTTDDKVISGPISPVKAGSFIFNLNEPLVISKNSSVLVKIVTDIKEDVVGDTKFTFVFRGLNGKNLVTGNNIKANITKNLKGTVVEVKGKPIVETSDKVVVSLSSAAIWDKMIYVGQKNPMVTQFDFLNNAGSDVALKNLVLATEADYGDNVEWVEILGDAGPKVAVVNGKAVFNNIELYGQSYIISKDTKIPLWVSVKLADTANSGDVMTFKVEKAEFVNSATAESFTVLPDAVSKKLVVRKSGLGIFGNGLDSNKLINGTQQVIAKLAVSPSFDEVEIGKMVFNINKTGEFELSNFDLVSANAPLFQVGNKYEEISQSEGTLTFMLSEVLSPGQTYNYDLVANIDGAGTDDTLAVTFDFAGETIVTDTYSNVKDAFVWSDISAVDHSAETKDWTNAYIINFIAKKITFVKQF